MADSAATVATGVDTVLYVSADASAPSALAESDDFRLRTASPATADEHLDAADCVVVTEAEAAPGDAADVPVVLYAADPPTVAADGFAGFARRPDGRALVDQIRRTLRTDVRARHDRITRLYEGTTDLVAADSETDLYERTVGVAEEVLEFDICYVSVVEGDEFVPVVRSSDRTDSGIGPVPVDHGVVGETRRTGESFLIRDLPAHGVAEPTHGEYGSGISVPLGEDAVFQAVAKDRWAFDESDLGLAELLCTYATETLSSIEAERRLREERDRLAALFENIPDAAVAFEMVDGDPVVRDVNSAFEEVFGYDAETVRGENIDEYVLPADPEAREEGIRLNRMLREGRSLRRECRRRTADGLRSFLLHVVPLVRDEANVAGYAIYTDITDRKERERTIGTLHETTRDLMRAECVEEVAEITVEAIRDVLGYPINALRMYDPESHTLEAVAATDEAVETLGERPAYGPGSVVWEAFEAGEPRVYDDVATADDPHDRSGVTSAMYVPAGDRALLSFSTPEPEACDEQELRLAQVLAANVEAALDRAERTRLLRQREAELARQNDRLEEFASVVSHDLRNPLSVASGHLELARETGDPESFDVVERALDRMDGLIEDLLMLARQGEVVGETEPLDAAAVARRAWAGVETGASTLDVDGEIPVEADRNRLLDLFENLFRNAVEHGSTSPPSHAREDSVEHGSTSSRTGSGDSVEHGSTSSRTGSGDSVEHGGPGVRVTVEPLPADDGFAVADDGPGVPASIRERVFESGFTTAEDGVGYGLAIVERIVEAHGWSIELAEGTADGARFEIRTG